MLRPRKYRIGFRGKETAKARTVIENPAFPGEESAIKALMGSFRPIFSLYSRAMADAVHAPPLEENCTSNFASTGREYNISRTGLTRFKFAASERRIASEMEVVMKRMREEGYRTW